MNLITCQASFTEGLVSLPPPSGRTRFSWAETETELSFLEREAASGGTAVRPATGLAPDMEGWYQICDSSGGV